MKRIIILLSILFSLQLNAQNVQILCNQPTIYNEKLKKEYYYTYTDPKDNMNIINKIADNISYKGLTMDSISIVAGEKTIMLLYIDDNGKLEDWIVAKKSWVNHCNVFNMQILPQIERLDWKPIECNGKRVSYQIYLPLIFSLRQIDRYIEESLNNCNHSK